MLLRCVRPMFCCSAGLPRPAQLVSFAASFRRIVPAVSGAATSLTAAQASFALRALPAAQQQQWFGSRPRSSGSSRGKARKLPAVAAAATEEQAEGESLILAAEMEPAAKKQRLEGGAAGQQQQQQQGKKKKKQQTPEMLARMEIHQAAKANDLATALAVFDRAKAEGVRLSTDLYVNLLYLCSSGDSWEQQLRQGQAAAEGGSLAAGAAAAGEEAASSGQQQQQQKQQQKQQEEAEQQQGSTANGDAAPAVAAAAAAAPAPAPQQPGAAERLRRAQELFDEMKGSGGKLHLNEMCYTALARLAALDGDADRAFQMAQDTIAAGIAPKLRSFTPALIAYAEQGMSDKAFEVDAAIAAQQLDLTEAEFSRLLQAAAAGGSWERAAGVLRRIGSELTVLQPDTLSRVRALFASPAAAAAFQQGTEAAANGTAGANDSSGADAAPASAAGGSSWAVVPTTISATGECASCGGQLKALDLSGDEMQQFAEGIAAIAERQERRPNDFQQFKAWLAKHGPFGAVIDGANVALYGQNFESGGFNFGQIKAVVNHLHSRHPDLKPLLMLHVGRTKSPQAKAPEAQQLLKDLTEKRSFYVTPPGSNDDWYWIYASVTAGEKGLLVSNDEMRDHIFQLLAPKYFLKWKQRHQLKYRFTTTGLHLDYPAPYTTCVQELDCGSWVFPGADGSWICAKRV